MLRPYLTVGASDRLSGGRLIGSLPAGVRALRACQTVQVGHHLIRGQQVAGSVLRAGSTVVSLDECGRNVCLGVAMRWRHVL